MKFTTVVAMLLGTGALIAGCGGSSPSTTASSTQHTTSTPSHTTSTPSHTASTPTHTASSAPTTPSSSSSSSKPSFANASNCLNLSGVGAKFAQALSAAVSGGKTLNLQAAVAAYNNLANAAPSAIKPDIQNIADAFSSFATSLENVHYKIGTVPTASQVAALSAATKSLDTSKVKTASQDIEAWARQNCS